MGRARQAASGDLCSSSDIRHLGGRLSPFGSFCFSISVLSAVRHSQRWELRRWARGACRRVTLPTHVAGAVFASLAYVHLQELRGPCSRLASQWGLESPGHSLSSCRPEIAEDAACGPPAPPPGWTTGPFSRWPKSSRRPSTGGSRHK